MVPFFDGLEEEGVSILLLCGLWNFEAFGIIYSVVSDDVLGGDSSSGFVSRDEVFFCGKCLYQSIAYFVEGGESLLFSALL